MFLDCPAPIETTIDRYVVIRSIAGSTQSRTWRPQSATRESAPLLPSPKAACSRQLNEPLCKTAGRVSKLPVALGPPSDGDRPVRLILSGQPSIRSVRHRFTTYCIAKNARKSIQGSLWSIGIFKPGLGVNNSYFQSLHAAQSRCRLGKANAPPPYFISSMLRLHRDARPLVEQLFMQTLVSPVSFTNKAYREKWLYLLLLTAISAFAHSSERMHAFVAGCTNQEATI